MLDVHAIPLGPLQTNCYVVASQTQAVVVDPGGEPKPVLDLLQAKGVTLTHVLCTHLHFDHIYGVAALAAQTGATVYAAAADTFMLTLDLGQGGMWGFPTVPAFTPQTLEEGTLTLCGEVCEVISTPGHSPGSLSFYFAASRVVFAGDTLFERSVGRSDLQGGDAQTLTESIRQKLFVLPEETVVYPGHGPATSIGGEKRNNPFVSDFA